MLPKQRFGRYYLFIKDYIRNLKVNLRFWNSLGLNQIWELADEIMVIQHGNFNL